MDLEKLRKRALEIRKLYDVYNEKHAGHAWSAREVMEGFVGDVGDLMKIVMAKEGSRGIDGDVDQKLRHELGDCLWCVLVLSDKYGVNLGEAFRETMDSLEERIKENK